MIINTNEVYKQMGAIPMEEWTVYKVHNETLDKLAMKFDNY
ncbi:hypothetical protein RBU49_02510 [Clostridium sp. MB40-C1]|nr:hypothetical protein [Clostridium sp. MB40-C1]WMJ81142.1 hypothetical protein RBU49_02510 [Clostridium sp. MB40-C1]